MSPYLQSVLPVDRSSSVTQQLFPDGWRFDFTSFAIGLIVALLLASLAYRSRARFARLWDQVKLKAQQLRERLTANMAARYSASAIETAQTMHMLSALAPLESIYVEIPLCAPLAPIEDATENTSLSLQQAIQASDRLFIIGKPGSGRTTLLNHLLLAKARQINSTRQAERVPVYIYLPLLALDLVDETESGNNQDETPAQRLVGTALNSMSRVVATGVARWLLRQVEAGNALVLLDGWDELPGSDQPGVTAWIKELFVAYPGNHIVVAAGERGYAPLNEAGFVPLRPLPWNEQQLTDLTKKWVAVWPSNDDGRTESGPVISYTLTPPTPLEATIELAIQLQGRRPARTPAGRMAQVMPLLLPEPSTDDQGQMAWPFETGHRALGHLAFAAFQTGQSTLKREEIQSAVTAAMPPPQFALDEYQEEDTTRQELKGATEEQDRRTLQIVDCCRALTATGAPIRTWDRKVYTFAHPLIAAFLSARHLASEGIDVADHADDPAWFDVARFYAGLASAQPSIGRLVSVPDDLFLNRLWTAAGLLAASPPGRAGWRVDLIKRLAQMFMNPRAPTYIRDRSVLALVHSAEAGVETLFKKTASSSDPQLRAGAIWGLGAMGRDQDLPLIETALADSDLKVRLAAVNALTILARMGNEQALELVVATMIEAEDETQRVAAEALAQLGPEGQAVLREGAEDHDLMVRRATVYGLAALKEIWSRQLLERMQREDDQWLVRNAAAEALAAIRVREGEDAPSIDLALPQAETEAWLIKWAAERGEGTGVGEAALATLMRALAEGDVSTRRAATETLRRLGDPRTIEALRQILRDPEPSLRQAALDALDEISRRHNITITMS